MFGIYTPVLILQALCFYHAYRRNAGQRWYWLIVLFPLVGCILYVVHTVANRSEANELGSDAVVSNRKVEELEKECAFSDSVANRISLADAYVEVGRYRDAIDLYSACLQGFMEGDPGLRMKLLQAYFMADNFTEAVRLGDGLQSEKSFRSSEARLAYAWALYHSGDAERADCVFRDMDHTFTNYVQRLEYCKFLVRTSRPDAAKAKLSELLDEFEQMQDFERRHKKPIQREIKTLYETLATRPA